MTSSSVFKKLSIAVLTACSASFAFGSMAFTPAVCHQDFPHWNCQNHYQFNILNKINTQMLKYAHKGYGAAFDWDGTVYSEQVHIKGPYLKNHTFSGQAAWVIWSAEHMKNHPNWFPMYQPSKSAHKNMLYLINHDIYTEGHTSDHLSDYSNFVQIAAYPTGMTPESVRQSVLTYLKSYPAKDYVFLPMMDLIQRFHNLGYNTWIISGSNPYYLANVIWAIQKDFYYKPGQHYYLGLIPNNFAKYPSHTGHVTGNDTLLNQKGRFSMVYNSEYVKTPGLKGVYRARYVVDKVGKALDIQNYIQRKEKAPVIFYAGNSSGDYQAGMYLLNHHYFKMPGAHTQKPIYYNGMVMAVDPQHEKIGDLQDVLNTSKRWTVRMPMYPNPKL